MISQLIDSLRTNKQRQLVRLVGDRSEVTAWLDQELKQCSELSTIWFGRADADNAISTKVNSTSLNHYFDARLKQYQKYLGQESDIVVFDCYAGLNPDALGALTGTIKQGGACLLITPTDQAWLEYPDPDLQRICAEPYTISDANHHYIARLISLINNTTTVLTWSDFNSVYTSLSHTPKLSEHSTHEVVGLSKSQLKQKDVVKKLVELGSQPGLQLPLQYPSQVLSLSELPNQDHSTDSQSTLRRINDERREGVVIQADRGRGKSAALGFAAAELLLKAVTQQSGFRILVTAPVSDSIRTIFRHAVATLSSQDREFEYDVQRQRLILKDKRQPNDHELCVLEFIAPDELSRRLPAADVVMVDEAAAIPMQLLTPVVKHYKKQVYSTTVHGYEGTGRGFEYKFKPLLKQSLQTFETFYMKQPIRWQENDWLERDINRLLALNLETSDASVEQKNLNAEALKGMSIGKKSAFEFQCCTLKNSPAGAVDDATLNRYENAFSLLTHAHYRTTPNDLRYMLDAPNVELMTLSLDGNLIAAALVVTEGNLPTALCDQIWQGRRRPRGNLFPQSLIAHSGFQQAGLFTYGRIVRIAVNPNIHKRGIGGVLLTEIEKNLASRQYDFVCTSFGYWHSLFRFWQKSDFVAVRLGIKAEASTAEHSIFMCKPLTQQAKPLFEELSKRFVETVHIEKQMGMPAAVRYYDDTLEEIELSDKEHDGECSQQDKYDLIAFAYHFRSVYSCLLAMYRFAKSHPKLLQTLKSRDVELINDLLSFNGVKSLQSRQAELIEDYDFSGEKQLVNKLRSLWQQLIETQS